MVLGWLDRKRQDSGEWTGFLEQGVKLEGRLETTGTFRVDAEMKGTLVSNETIILGENGQMEGQIESNHVIVAGRFDGTIRGVSKVEIQPKAVVTGDVFTNCLIIEPGAIFDGRCHMTSSSDQAEPIVIPIRSAAART